MKYSSADENVLKSYRRRNERERQHLFGTLVWTYYCENITYNVYIKKIMYVQEEENFPDSERKLPLGRTYPRRTPPSAFIRKVITINNTQTNDVSGG